MLCESCGSRPAALIFTRLTDNDYINLCPSCRKQNLRKNILTELHQCVNLSSPARTGHNLNHINNVNTKTLALISGVLACAFGQIKNILSGDESGCEKQPEAPKDKKPIKTKSAPEPEPEEEEEEDDDTEVTVETEDEDETDYDALRATMKKLVAEKVETNKEAVRAALAKTGAKKVGDVPNDKLEVFIAALKKIK